MHPVYRNIGYSPRIWGVSYLQLFSTLFCALGAMILGRCWGIVCGIVLALVAGGGLYGFFYAWGHADQAEFWARLRRMNGRSLAPYQSQRGGVIWR